MKSTGCIRNVLGPARTETVRPKWGRFIVQPAPTSPTPPPAQAAGPFEGEATADWTPRLGPLSDWARALGYVGVLDSDLNDGSEEAERAAIMAVEAEAEREFQNTQESAESGLQ